jgi:hypothetical protein
MTMAKVGFQKESLDTVSLDPELRKKFLSVTDVERWKLDRAGQVLCTGLIVNGLKALPDGGFQSVTEFALDPTKGIPMNAIPAIQNAVMTEFEKRVVIIIQSGPGTPPR